MKSRFSYLILAAFIFLFGACSKEVSNEDAHGTTPQKGDFYATINGDQWDADSLQLVEVSNNGVTINGLSRTGIEISMVLPEFKTGTYNLNAASIPFAFYVNLFGSLTDVYYSNEGTASGTVTISSIDTANHLVSGSFQFTLMNPADKTIKTVTNGVFGYLPYNTGTGPITQPTASSDTLTAKVDTSPFNPFQITASATGGQLVLAGITTDGSTLALLMPDNITAGTYDLDFGTGIYIGVFNAPGTTMGLVSQANGTLHIISHDTVAKRIRGTFSFIASPITSGTPVTITEGFFAISYQ